MVLGNNRLCQIVDSIRVQRMKQNYLLSILQLQEAVTGVVVETMLGHQVDQVETLVHMEEVIMQGMEEVGPQEAVQVNLVSVALRILKEHLLGYINKINTVVEWVIQQGVAVTTKILKVKGTREH